MVLSEQGSRPFRLPNSGLIKVGRAPENDLAIEDPQISREHLLLHVGDVIQVEDLGSANGTFLGQEQLPPRRPTAVSPGQTIELGGTTLLIQSERRPAAKAMRTWSHGYFEARLEEECLRDRELGVRAGRARLVVLRLRLEDQEGEPELLALVSETCPGALVAAYAPGEYELLLLDTPRERGEEIAENLRRALADAEPRVGLASYPEDGRSADQLVARASAGVRDHAPVEAFPEEVVVADAAMLELHRLIDKVARGTISVMLLGETGVGKEVVAETVHRRSLRQERPFVRLNCAALSESLVESELFGYEKGAFTGAVAAKPGLLETAAGGTVFLDELGEMTMGLQAKLLRVIEQRQVMRVGGLKPREIDVRFVSATNRDLEAEIRRGAFRQDLYYRLNGVVIEVPPLRARSREILPLAQLFLARGAVELGRRAPAIGERSRSLLERYPWPGNIRELKNVIERALLLCSGDRIEPEHLPVDKMSVAFIRDVAPAEQAPARRSDRPPIGVPIGVPLGAPLGAEDTLTGDRGDHGADRGERSDGERQRILEALEACAGNQTRAAKLLGIARRTLTTRLEEYDIPRPRKR
jgi:DNA-binding NtrC family response regulator